MTTVDVVAPAIEARPSGRSLGWWGTVCLIATEGMLFALLLFGNFYLRANAAQWPPPGVEDPELRVSGIRTAILLGSTIPAVIAERAAKKERRGLQFGALATTWVMGTVFLVGHVTEYLDLVEKMPVSKDAYSSIFYTITNLHALHVFIGLLILLYLMWRVVTRHQAAGHDPDTNGLMYWHFVDVVWVFVYSSLYLSVVWW